MQILPTWIVWESLGSIWNARVACSLSHGLHGQGREPVGDHAADDEEGEGGGLQDVHARLHPQTDHEGAVPQSDGSQAEEDTVGN